MPDPQDLLSRLEQHASHDPAFSQQEIEVLRQVIEAYRSWAMLGRATKWLVLLLAGISGAIISLSHLGDAIKKWLAS